MRSLLAIIVAALLLASCDSSHDQAPGTAPPPGSPDPPESIEELTAKAMAYLKERQAALQDEFKLGSYERYDWDQDKAELVFSDAGIPKVVADIQFVGSISTRSDTWMWSWANPTVDEAMSREILKVRAHGESHGHEKLTDDLWPAEQVDGWEMTAIAAYLLDAVGAYRSPDGDGYTFMVMSDIRFAEGAERPQDEERDDAE